MESITKEQYNALKLGKLHPSLPPNILSDIMYIKTILLTAEGENYYVQYIELDELSEAEIVDIMSSDGDFIRLSV